MLLESITLENFRQFRHESIDFAQGENGKNVTIIIGEMVRVKPLLLRRSSGVCTERLSSPIKYA